MAEKNRRDKAFFIRISEKELEIIEAAIRIRYGEVDGVKSRFARDAMLRMARAIIAEERKRRRGV